MCVCVRACVCRDHLITALLSGAPVGRLLRKSNAHATVFQSVFCVSVLAGNRNVSIPGLKVVVVGKVQCCFTSIGTIRTTHGRGA